jgi:hypothetical protein
MAVEIFGKMGKSGDLTVQEKWALSADIFGTLISTGKLQKGGLNSIFLREKYCNAK